MARSSESRHRQGIGQVLLLLTLQKQTPSNRLEEGGAQTKVSVENSAWRHRMAGKCTYVRQLHHADRLSHLSNTRPSHKSQPCLEAPLPDTHCVLPRVSATQCT